MREEKTRGVNSVGDGIEKNTCRYTECAIHCTFHSDTRLSINSFVHSSFTLSITINEEETTRCINFNSLPNFSRSISTPPLPHSDKINNCFSLRLQHILMKCITWNQSRTISYSHVFSSSFDHSSSFS